MKNMEPKHWALVAAMLGALSVQLAGLEHGWVDATSPMFVAGVLGQLATTITALFVGPPQNHS